MKLRKIEIVLWVRGKPEEILEVVDPNKIIGDYKAVIGAKINDYQDQFISDGLSGRWNIFSRKI